MRPCDYKHVSAEKWLIAYLGVYKPKATACLILSQAFLDEILDNLLGYSDTSRSSPHEYRTLSTNRNMRLLKGVDNACQDDSSSTLNIIVEAAVFVLILLESRERVLEVLKLDDNSEGSLVSLCLWNMVVSSYPGQTLLRAIINSSMNSISSFSESFRAFEPMYNGSFKSFSLLVPRSRVNGRVRSGRIPAQPVYNASFPTGIPIPLTPRSPKPRIREPSGRIYQ